MKNWIQDGLQSARIQGGTPARDEEIVARFGEATLVRSGGQSGVRIGLRGGSMADRMEALEWMAIFMPEAATRLKE